MEKNKPTGKKAQSRRKIMHAAKYLFERDGIENVTFGHIAEEAEMCRTTVFNHFGGTQELLAALFEQEMDDIRDYCDGLDLKGRAMIEAIFDRFIEDTAYYPVLTYRIVSSAILKENGEDNALIHIETMVYRCLTEEKHDDAKLLTIAVMGAYYGLVNHYHSGGLKFRPDEMKKEMHKLLDIIIGGNGQ